MAKDKSRELAVSGQKRKRDKDMTRLTTEEDHTRKKQTQPDEKMSTSHIASLSTSIPNSDAELISPSTSKLEAITSETDNTGDALTKKRNAFQELMASKSVTATTTTKIPSGLRLPNPNSRGKGYRRGALGLYTSNTSKIPKELRLYETADCVAIVDMYPKSTIHTLLLFKSDKNTLHPFHFLEDPNTLAKAQEEAKKLRQLVAKEMQRKFGKYSAQDKIREQVLNGELELPEGENLFKGRDWEKEVMVGVHARPSMDHVHIHVLSPDRFSECVKSKNHYQSFSTPFFVNLDEFPLAEDDPRWDSINTNSYIDREFTCWRCKSRFTKFVELKRHLAEEFEEWKAE